MMTYPPGQPYLHVRPPADYNCKVASQTYSRSFEIVKDQIENNLRIEDF